MCDSGPKQGQKMVRFWRNLVCTITTLQTKNVPNFIEIGLFLISKIKKSKTKNCPISIKFGAFFVWSVVIIHTKFRQNRTIFGPSFGRELQTRGTPIPNFWYFFTLNKIWKWVDFEKNQWLQSWCWFYSVSWNLGCGATPIWAAWDQKYFSYLINSQKGLMGSSFDKIPEIELPPVLMTWKICLLKAFFITGLLD